MNTDDHPAIVEAYAAKSALSKQFGPQALPFAFQMRKFETASRAQGIKFVDLSQKGPSAYAKRIASAPPPKNYWQRQPVRPFIDPIEEELKVLAQKASQKQAAGKPAARHSASYHSTTPQESFVVREDALTGRRTRRKS